MDGFLLVVLATLAVCLPRPKREGGACRAEARSAEAGDPKHGICYWTIDSVDSGSV
jgi:hypothetical protein